MATINRVNGMVSGFDTESLVKNLMKLEKTKTDKVYREKQSVNWQKDSYREVMSLFRGFQSEYLDVLKPGSNMRSATAFNAFSANAQISGADSGKVSVTTSSGSSQGTITIDSITKLATKDTWVSSTDVNALQGSNVSLDAVNAALAAGNNTISVTLDGTAKMIDLTGGTGTGGSYANMAELVTNMNVQIANTFGAGRITVSESADRLMLSTAGHTVIMGEGDSGLLGNLGFLAGESNTLSMSSSLSDAFGVLDSDVAFSINGVSSSTMGITASDTIQTMVKKINGSGAGVTMSYSNLTNGFTMKSAKEGVANNITLADTGGFFSDKLKLSSTSGRTAGQDAEFTVNGMATTRSDNKIVVDGTTIQLKGLSASAIDITVTPDTKKVKENIIKFVNQYNELIEKVNGKVAEERYRNYTPLTDEEKAVMSEDNIKLWETKAKSGLLKGDSILSNMMQKLRSAFSESVSGSGISLADMGITPSVNYKENGKLIIDESKLETALASRSSEITTFFTGESSFEYGDSANNGTRYAQNGLAARVNDILNDNIRVTRDASGKKGLLVDKAGYEKASSDITSEMAKKLTTLESRYVTLLNKMNDTENRYYAKFTAMESALSKMNSQSSSLSGMFSSGS